MSTTSTYPRGASFSRTRATRTVSGFATVGLMVGISLAGAAPAVAATDADCDAGNTVDSTDAGIVADIQTLLDASTPIVCLSGTFLLSSPLTFDHDLTIHGLTDAVLDGDGVTGILDDDDYHELTVENLTFRNGQGGDGGAIRSFVVIVHDSQFLNNKGGLGGAIIADSVSIYDSYFSDNVADEGGGAVAGQYSVSVIRTTFADNTADGLGGAIITTGEVTAESSTFERNVSRSGGGAIAAYGVVTSDASTFVDNRSEGIGGAIAVEGTVDVQNSTFVSNLTSDGQSSAISARGGSIRQSTFLDNAADSGDPAEPAIITYDETLEVRGNIFAGSSGPAHLGAVSGGTVVDLGGNVFTTGEASETDLSSVQPTTQFGVAKAAIFAGAVLADNSGPTQTVALYAGSPALSAVPADAASMTVDQRGVARPAISDAGAYEFDDADPAGGSGDGAELANTGTETAGWLTGMAALLFAGGLTVLGFTRRRIRRTI